MVRQWHAASVVQLYSVFPEWSWRKDELSTRDLSQGQATCSCALILVPKGIKREEIHRQLAVRYRQSVYSLKCMSGSKYLKAAKPVLLRQVRTLIHIHKRANMEYVQALFLELLALPLLVLGTKLYWSNRLHATVTWHTWTTEPHSQHVTVWPWGTGWPGLSNAFSHTTKIFQYCGYFLFAYACSKVHCHWGRYKISRAHFENICSPLE
jgi:hypothetical protein